MTDLPHQDNSGTPEGQATPSYRAEGRGWSDQLAASLLVGAFGAFCGAATAWAVYARIGWIIAWGVIGYLLVAGLSWLLRPLTAQPYQAVRWATDKPTAPSSLGEAVQGALRQQWSFLTFDAIIWGLSGVVIGAALGGRALSSYGESAVVAGVVVGGVVGIALRAALHLLGAAGATAIDITLLRKLGFPGGSALIGALIGALMGFALWKRWELSWPLVGALAVGAPMALLFALMGWERLRSTRP